MEIAIKFSREGGPRRAAGWWLRARPRFLPDFWGRNFAEAEPSPRLPPAPRSLPLEDWSRSCSLIMSYANPLIFFFSLSFPQIINSVVLWIFPGLLGVITTDQSRTVTVLKVTVTQSSFISSFVHLPLQLDVYSPSVLCTGNKTEFTVAPLLDITGNRVLLCSQPVELGAEELWKGWKGQNK